MTDHPTRLISETGPVAGIPRWRGRIHQVTVPFALTAGTVLIVLAPAGPRRAAVTVYAAALTALFAVSAGYHRWPWGERGRAVLRRADHSTILVFIAATFTPVTVATTGGGERVGLLVVMWSAAVTGLVIRTTWHHVRPAVIAVVYVTVGLCGVSVLPATYQRAGVAAFVCFLTGGVLYLIGAGVYARRSPDPRPAVFGFHEVFHTLTVLAASLQYVGLSIAVLGTRT